MKSNFEQILKRIAIIDRDIAELQRLHKRLSEDRPYYKDLHIVFEKQIYDLLKEKNEILSLSIQNPPAWLTQLNGKEFTKPESHYIPENIVNFSPISPFNGDEVYQLIKQFPKTEVHLHLEACINKETLHFLFEKNEIPFDENEFHEKFNFKDLNGFIQLFFYIQSAIKEEEDFAYILDSLADYLREDNIVYAEVFLAPTRFVQNGLDFTKMMEIIIERIRDIRKEDGTDIRILIDVSRTFGLDNALANLEKVLQVSHHEEILGIGLGGAELLGPAKDYERVFRIAREAGLHCVAHAGEDDGPWSIWDSLKYLQVERIGHGTSAIQDPELIEYLKENRIPIEICLTSNLFTGKYVRKAENHPVRYYYDSGLMLCINTDDPEIFNVKLTDEYYKLYRHLNFTTEEIIDLIKKGVYSSFHPRKDKLWKKMELDIQKIQSKLQQLV